MASKKRNPVATKEKRAATVARICDRLRAGGCSIREACRQEGVAIQTVQDWAAKDDELTGQYAQARADGLALDADDIHTLAATKPDDAAHAQSLRLQVDTLKWDVCKRIPKVYGDKMTLAGDKDAPLVLSDTERAARLEALMTSVRKRLDAEARESE
jgi:hypothetical protein